MRMISLLALVGASCLATVGQELAFAPEPGKQFLKTFESSLDLTLEEWTLQHTEWPKPLSQLWSDVTLAEKRRSVVVDEYVAPLVDRRRSWLRTFESLSLEQWMDYDNLSNDQDFHGTSEGHSPLEGARVHFTEEAGATDPTVTFADGDHDLELLEGLEEELDLRAFLPSGTLKTGSTWSVDAAALRSFLEPGGRIVFVDAEGNRVESLDPGFVDSFQGTLEVVFADRRDIDGARAALLRIHGRPIASTEPVESAGEVQFGLGYSSPGTNRVSASLELDVVGEILWDLEGRHLRSAWLAADVVVRRETHGRTTDGFSETWVRETWRGCVYVDVRVTRK